MTRALAVDTAEDLILRARAISALAAPATGDDPLEDLDSVLARLGMAPLGPAAAQDLASALDRGVVPAYETSYDEARRAPGGLTFQMADVAGFYRAFGFQVTGERPDHLVPELEFVALLLVKEAHATLSGDHDASQVCRDARLKFVREHLGLWLAPAQTRAEEEGCAGAASVLGLLARLLEE